MTKLINSKYDFHNRHDYVEEWVSIAKNKSFGITQSERKKKEWRKPKDLWETNKRNISIMRIPEGEERENKAEKFTMN